MEKKTLKQKHDLELKALDQILMAARKELKSLNYTFEIREGEIKRTVITEVYNGTDFD